MLPETKAVWYLGGQLEQMQKIYTSAVNPAPAVHFQADVWRQRYINTIPVTAEATDMHPSPLWTGMDMLCHIQVSHMEVLHNLGSFAGVCWC